MRLGERIKRIAGQGTMAVAYGVGQAYYTRPEAQAVNPKETTYQGVVGGAGVLGALAGDWLRKSWLSELSEPLITMAVGNASANGTQMLRQKLAAGSNATQTTTNYAVVPQPQVSQPQLGMDGADMYGSSL